MVTSCFSNLVMQDTIKVFMGDNASTDYEHDFQSHSDSFKNEKVQ